MTVNLDDGSKSWLSQCHQRMAIFESQWSCRSVRQYHLQIRFYRSVDEREK